MKERQEIKKLSVGTKKEIITTFAIGAVILVLGLIMLYVLDTVYGDNESHMYIVLTLCNVVFLTIQYIIERKQE